ncbi:Putative prophage CPS-53 integrase [Pigmentiphaga humi]|uniref:Prophage CPS-53 integrase n=1 Tax=Pigmentiphaga humi TaxID=2478468 RepID=A0A3P4B8H2_9BURK|nr:Putative prophage CPS-53 integrase [Pigmentiphaga humi]
MPLTDTAVSQAKPRAKPYKLANGDGLYLLVNPDGGKYWRWNYRHLGKQKTLAYGVYPDVTLAGARDRHQEARKLLAAGSDPGEVKQASKRAETLAAANSFEADGKHL